MKGPLVPPDEATHVVIRSLLEANKLAHGRLGSRYLPLYYLAAILHRFPITFSYSPR